MSKIMCNEIVDVYNVINKDFSTNSDKIKIDLIYAFNGTGKTRISRLFNEKLENKVLCFNSMFQDEFKWDNGNSFLIINSNSWILKFIKDQGLENAIEDNFKMFFGDSIVASLDLELGIINFSAKTIDGFEDNIKISKAEESVFIWTIFYTFIDSMIYELNENKEDRSTDIFDDIDYIIIDDPVSSVDDVKILNIAVKLFELVERINKIPNKVLNILITTHHALFYNTIYNLFNRVNYVKFKSIVFTKEKYNYFLESKGDSPFGYHLVLKNKILDAINSNSVEKIHFNMFRILLEKTSNYFGYKKYDECLPYSSYKQEIIKLINLYSHGSLPEFEYSELTDNEKDIFIKSFNDFISYYKVGGNV